MKNISFTLSMLRWLLMLVLTTSSAVSQESCMFLGLDPENIPVYDVPETTALETVVFRISFAPANAQLRLGDISGVLGEIYRRKFVLRTLPETQTAELVLVANLELPSFPSTTKAAYLSIHVNCQSRDYIVGVVNVFDVNDKSPEFYDTPYMVTVPDSSLPGSSIDLPLLAIDWDPAPVYNVLFSLENYNDLFKLEPIPGLLLSPADLPILVSSGDFDVRWSPEQLPPKLRLSLLRSLEPESLQQPLMLNINAKDLFGGEGSRSSSTTVLVTVTEASSSRPYISTTQDTTGFRVISEMVNSTENQYPLSRDRETENVTNSSCLTIEKQFEFQLYNVNAFLKQAQECVNGSILPLTFQSSLLNETAVGKYHQKSGFNLSDVHFLRLNDASNGSPFSSTELSESETTISEHQEVASSSLTLPVIVQPLPDSLFISENRPIGDPLLSVLAFSGEPPSLTNSKLQYEVLPKNSSFAFLNSTNILILQRPVAEGTYPILLRIYSSENQSQLVNTKHQMRVVVLPRPNHYPLFANLSYVFYVDPNIAHFPLKLHQFRTIVADDGRVEYTLIGRNSEILDLNQDTGELFANQEVVQEVDKRPLFFIVRATNREFPRYFSDVSVAIMSHGSSNLVFPQSSIHFIINQEITPGARLNLSAPVKSAQSVRYWLAPNSSILAVDTKGQLFTQSGIKPGNVSQNLSFTIYASDDIHTASASLILEIISNAQNSTIFHELNVTIMPTVQPTSIVTSETTSQRATTTQAAQVQKSYEYWIDVPAQNLDKGAIVQLHSSLVNSSFGVVYELINGGDDMFRIDPVTGEVFIDPQLAEEVVGKEFVLKVKAKPRKAPAWD